MTQKNIKLGFIVLLLVLFLKSECVPYDNEYVHQSINENASFQAAQFYSTLRNFGFTGGNGKDLIENNIIYGQTMKFWLREGARLEDETVCRSRNHFHDPLKSWGSAGLNNSAVNSFCLLIGFESFSIDSSLIWAQKQSVNPWHDNLWSWPKARQSYYKALTFGDKDLKEQFFAKTFRSLGQVMHLIADSSVPAHVRNDIHVFPLTVPGIGIEVGSQTYESWARQNHNKLSYAGVTVDNSFFNQSVPNASAPVAISALWDQDKYDGSGIAQTIGSHIGLAEYTNANFFSEDTIFRDYPHPAYSDTNYITAFTQPEVVDAEDGKFDNRVYIKKTVGDADARLASFSYISYDLIKKGYYNFSPLVLDDKVYNDYAALLIPRAVGYSAGFLNYFFRGTLEVSAPDTYVYSITDGSKIPHQFTKIKAKVKNTTPNEVMSDGILQAVARYKVVPNYDPNLANYPPNGTTMQTIPFSYSVSAAITLTPEELASMNVYPTEFTFDFTNSKIPAGITDLYLQVVFKGTLGNEKDTAIAVGMKDLMEPTHHVFWNSTDRFLLDGVLYTATEIRNSSKLRNKVDHDRDKVLNEIHEGEPYIDPYNMIFDIAYMNTAPPANPVVYSATASNLPPGRHIRLIVLVDNNYVDNWFRLTHFDTVFNVDKHSDYSFKGVTNQEENGLWLQPTPLKVLRGIRQHFYAGVVACQPIATVPETGVKYCPYPETAPPPADSAPYPVTIINFQ